MFMGIPFSSFGDDTADRRTDERTHGHVTSPLCITVHDLHAQ